MYWLPGVSEKRVQDSRIFMKSEPSTLVGVGGGDGLYSVDGQGKRVRQETERQRKKEEEEG